MYIVKPEYSYNGNFPSFVSVKAFEEWFVQNTGYFEKRENVALVNYDTQECKFYKLNAVITAFEMREGFAYRKLED